MDLEIADTHEKDIVFNTDEYRQRQEYALKNPRDLTQNLELLETLATSSVKNATSCFYCLKSGEKNVYGLSVRFAELILHIWKNIGSVTVTNKIDKLKQRITVTSTVTDFEKNTSYSTSVSQRLFGKPSETDYNMAIRAAKSIAFRDAMLRIIPYTPYLASIFEKIKAKSMSETTLEHRWTQLSHSLQLDYGITEGQILRSLNTTVDDITPEHLVTLAGFLQALNDKHATPKDIFKASVESKIASDVISRL